MNTMPLWVSLFFGITFGMFVALIGATLLFATRNRKAAATVLVLGLLLLFGTVASYMFS